MVRYLVLVWLCLAATIAYVQRISLGVAESTIRKELDIDKDAMGWIGALFFLSYALFQLPTGWLAHTFGSRRALPVFSVLWSAATGCLALASGFASLVGVRLAMGAGQAGIFPASTTTITRWFPLTRRSVACGLLAAFMSAGGALGSAITGYLVEGIGWRTTFALYALPGILWAVGFWLWFRDSPEEHSWVDEKELAAIRPASLPPIGGRDDSPASAQAAVARSSSASERVPWAIILGSPAMWWIGVQQFCRAAGYVFFATWFATYLQETRGVSVAESGLLNSFVLLGVVFGSLTGGAVSDWLLERTGSRRVARQYFSAVTLVCCAGLVVGAFFIQGTMLAVLAISAGTFFASCSGPCAYALSMDLGGRHVATVFSFMNMCGNLGAFAFPLLVPKLLGWTGSWDAVLFTFAIIHFVAAVCWLCFNANRDLISEA